MVLLVGLAGRILKLPIIIHNSKVDGYNFIFSSRNGSLVENYGVFGFDFQWQQKDRTTSPDPNTNNQSEYLNEKNLVLGLWGRYYFPIGRRIGYVY